MPTRKQRRKRQQKFRHEQAWYEVDEFGNEIELDPDEVKADLPEKRTNGTKPAAKASAQRGGRQTGRAGRTPPVPSWGRAVRRGGMLGAVVLVLFSFGAKGHIWSAVPLAALYTALFIPFTYWIDRLAYRRWEAKASGTAPAKKR
jgi:hypothetical protein